MPTNSDRNVYLFLRPGLGQRQAVHQLGYNPTRVCDMTQAWICAAGLPYNLTPPLRDPNRTGARGVCAIQSPAHHDVRGP